MNNIYAFQVLSGNHIYPNVSLAIVHIQNELRHLLNSFIKRSTMNKLYLVRVP
jgi:hypothetical protein